MDKAAQDKNCLIMVDDYARFESRYNVICSKALVEISKLKLALGWTLTFSPINMMGSLWLVNDAFNAIEKINLLIGETEVIGNNLYSENLEEMTKLSGYKEFFKENPHNFGFPAA